MAKRIGSDNLDNPLNLKRKKESFKKIGGQLDDQALYTTAHGKILNVFNTFRANGLQSSPQVISS